MKLPAVILIVLLVLVGSLASAQALDIVTADGTTYRNCAITAIEPDTLAFTHANGTARIAYENLPDALKTKYFDAAKVAAYRQQVQQARDAAAAKAAQEQRDREQADLQEKLHREMVADNEHQDEADRRAAMIEEQLAMKEAEERPEKIRKIALIMSGVCALGLFLRLLMTRK